MDHPQLTIIDAFALAKEAGDGRAQGTVLLGALSHRMPFPIEDWRDAIARWVPTKAIQVNLKAFDLGREFQPSIQVHSPVPTRPPELCANYLVTPNLHRQRGA